MVSRAELGAIQWMANEIEYIQTKWRADWQEGNTPLADFTADYLHGIGYRRVEDGH